MISMIIWFLSGCGVQPDLILQNQNAEIVEGEVRTDSMEPEILDDSEAADNQTVIMVYICGAVQRPGVYEAEEGSRIYQILDQAGGFSEEADARSINLAEMVRDGQMICIPTVEEVQAGEIPEGMKPVGESQTKAVNINTASVEELKTLPGIGDAKAEAIVAYRNEHGFFARVEDITQVNGIADSTFEKIKDDITI